MVGVIDWLSFVNWGVIVWGLVYWLNWWLLRGVLFIRLTGGYCVGSFVVCVLLLSGFGVRVDELELVGVVWAEVVYVDWGGGGGGGGGY